MLEQFLRLLLEIIMMAASEVDVKLFSYQALCSMYLLMHGSWNEKQISKDKAHRERVVGRDDQRQSEKI